MERTRLSSDACPPPPLGDVYANHFEQQQQQQRLAVGTRPMG